ncbi:MAG: hypothetical protein RLO17_01280 [Cyclobacteriaceae bacterium]
MKTYSRILGIISFLTCLGLLGLWIFGFFQLMEDDPEELWILLLLAIPLYTLIHFIIIHRFGFNLNIEFTKSQKVSTLVLIIIFSCIFIFMLPSGVKKFNRTVTLEQELSKAVQFRSDTTAYGYIGHLTTKYIDGKILYQFYVRSEKEFKPTLTGFSINFVDEDGFLIDNIRITDYSKNVDNNDRVFGLTSNSSEYFTIGDYKRIADWDLAVTTSN